MVNVQREQIQEILGGSFFGNCGKRSIIIVCKPHSATEERATPYLFRVDWKWTFAFAIWAVADPELPRRILIKWTKSGTAFNAIEFHIFQLWKYAAPPRHHTRNTNKIIEMRAPKVAKSRCQGKVSYPDVDFGMNTGIAREIDKNGAQRNFVKYFEHRGRGVGQKVCQYSLG